MRDKLEQALTLHRAGRIEPAEAAYREILALRPDHPEALHLMGVIAIQTGRFAEAEAWIGKALSRRPDYPEALNNLGNALKGLGRPADAIAAFSRAVQLQPDFPAARNNLGVCLQAEGRLEEALAEFDHAVRSKPDYAEAVVNRAQMQERLGRLPEAAESLALAATLIPGNADLHNGRGNLLRQVGRLAEAAEAYGAAALLRPEFHEFHINHGVALSECRRLPESIRVLRHALALAPDHPRALIALGVSLGMSGRGEEAVEILRRAVQVAPEFPPAHGNLGLALARQGRLLDAAQCQRDAIRLQPDYAVAHNNLALVLTESGQADEAMAAVEEALRLRPDLPEAYMTRGTLLKGLDRLEEAEASLRRALALKPGSAEAHTGLGSVLHRQWRLDEAEQEFRAALALWPDFAAANVNLGGTLQMLARPMEAAECYQRVLAGQPDDPLAFGYLLFSAMYRDDLDPEAITELHRSYGRAMARPGLDAPALSRPRAEDAGRPLRIAYLSSDLRNHPVATNLLPVVKAHDRSRFSLHFYANVASPDAFTAQFRELADGWHDICGLSDRQAAERIRADGIDILVSLAGRFDLNRPQICAWRAAPVQISLHEVATSGLDAMDYIIGDGRLLPRHSDEYFSERRLRLPSFYIANPPAGLPPLADGPRSGPAVLGCFNNPAKITPAMARLWGRILAARPATRLVLKYHQAYATASLRAHLHAAITAGGAGADQIDFRWSRESASDFLALYNEIDIALDTGPFSGSTTSFQALSMGVPVLTLPGGRMVSRWTASMLKGLGLSEWIADSPDHMVSLAVQGVDAVAAWRGRRAAIRQNLLASSLCDTARWTRNLERLYRAVWRRHCHRAG